MVHYGGAVKAIHSEGRPHDLVVHESMKQLLHEVQDLKARTESLERDNAGLKLANVHLKQELKAAKNLTTSSFFPLAVQSNLSGYAASEASSTGRVVHGIAISPDKH